MTTPIRNLDRLYVATPCSSDWDSMEGDNRIRFCRHCNLNVYNISLMTRRQAEALIANNEGRLCTRFYRRADGTILTEDCPIGLRAVRRRVSRVAGAAFGLLLSLFTGAGVQVPVYAGQPQDGDAKVRIKRTKLSTRDGRPALSGTIFDSNRAVIVGAGITLIDERTKEAKSVNTSDEGEFQFAALENDSYTLVVEASGFVTFREKGLKIRPDESLALEITLEVASMGGAAFLPEKHSSRARAV